MATPYENKTIAEVKALIISGLQQQWNNNLRILPKSFIKVLATVLAGVFVILFKQIGWIFLQIYPETAYWGEVNILGVRIRPLVKWGVLLGVGEPRRGTQWRGVIRIDVIKTNTVLDISTQLKSDLTGKIYLTYGAKKLENSIETIPVACADLGTAGNLEPGEKLYFVGALGNVKKDVEIVEVFQNAVNDETEGDYRYRVVNRYRVQPQGGSLADYRIWASEVPGVLNTYPYNDPDSPAGVILYISGNQSVFPSRIPSAELLVQVGDACTYNPETGKAARKPMTAILDPELNGLYSNILPVSLVDFDIYIDGLSGIDENDFSVLVRPAVEDYFLAREPYIRGLSDDNNKTNVVSRNNVSSTVDQIAISVKAEFETVTMRRNGEVETSYTLGIGQLCWLERLFINGVEY